MLNIQLLGGDGMHNFKKKYGQNFLRDESILNKIIEEANIKDNSLVIEIGPGDGALTDKLKNVSRNVIAYEIDNELELILNKKFKNTNVDIIFDDFLNRNIKEDINNYKYENIYIVANIPYYITTPIIEHIIKSNIKVYKIILMVQKEVADRFNATPGSKDYSSITVYLNYYFNIKKLFNVKKDSFYPKPKVDSAIICFEEKKEKPIIDEKKFFKFVRDCFRFKRKNLKNNLINYDLIKIEEVLKRNNLDLTVRAESISLELFIEIYNCLYK